MHQHIPAKPRKRLKQTNITDYFHVATGEGDHRKETDGSTFAAIDASIGQLEESEWSCPTCSCNSGCGRQCNNRRRRIECDENTCKLETCKNRPWLQYAIAPASLEVRATPLKGLGAFAREPIPKGAIIREYVGEIISQGEKTNCELNRARHYMMQYGMDTFIDAERFGNDSRFFNRCCAPNSVAEEWTVAGMYRVGIVATENIEIAKEITFDYGRAYNLKTCKCNACCR